MVNFLKKICDPSIYLFIVKVLVPISICQFDHQTPHIQSSCLILHSHYPLCLISDHHNEVFQYIYLKTTTCTL